MKTKVRQFFEKLDYRHYICVGITIAFALTNAFVFPYTFPRLWESIRDFGLSIAYYFLKMVKVDGVYPTVIEYSAMPFSLSDKVPKDWGAFKESWNLYWTTFAKSDTFYGYTLSLSNAALIVSYVITIIIPIVMALVILYKTVVLKPNNNYGVDTKALKVFKRLSDKTYRPIKSWIKDFIEFVNTNKYYRYIWRAIWLLSFNIVSIFFEALAFYFYFVVSFDFATIYKQLYKLLLDLSVMIKFVPVPVWICIGLYIFNAIRKRRGYDNLNHMELKNRGFINERPIVSMICGTMGKGKTTVSTDMTLSTDIMIRDEAYKILLKTDLMFPYFDWIVLENCIKEGAKRGKIYNLRTARIFLRTVHTFYDKSKRNVSYRKAFIRRLKKVYGYTCKDLLFNYDVERYGVSYNNGLYIVDIWTALNDYVQAYFLYVMSSSYIQSNYSIRTDVLKKDIGNFPVWDSDFFKREPKLMHAHSRHSHILNFDALKLGKTLVENNNNNYFEFGVISITEIGKERGNNLELQEVSKSADEGNQKNDLFNAWLKMVRHSCTIDNYPFVKVFCDEQRPESWGADARDTCEIIHIKGHSEQRLAMPGFFLEEILHALLQRIFEPQYKTYRYLRGDNSLFIYIMKSIYARYHDYYIRTYSTFGFKEYDVGIESGTQEGGIEPKVYYIMAKKIYSKRFSTDCFSNVFEERVSKATIGLPQIPEFKGENATFEEMDEMKSYFFRELTRLRNKKEDKQDNVPEWVKRRTRNRR